MLLWANLVFSCCSGIGFPSLAPLGWWFCAVSCPSLGQAGDLNSSGWVKLEAKFNVVSDGLKRNKVFIPPGSQSGRGTGRSGHITAAFVGKYLTSGPLLQFWAQNGYWGSPKKIQNSSPCKLVPPADWTATSLERCWPFQLPCSVDTAPRVQRATSHFFL